MNSQPPLSTGGFKRLVSRINHYLLLTDFAKIARPERSDPHPETILMLSSKALSGSGLHTALVWLLNTMEVEVFMMAMSASNRVSTP